MLYDICLSLSDLLHSVWFALNLIWSSKQPSKSKSAVDVCPYSCCKLQVSAFKCPIYSLEPDDDALSLYHCSHPESYMKVDGIAVQNKRFSVGCSRMHVAPDPIWQHKWTLKPTERRKISGVPQCAKRRVKGVPCASEERLRLQSRYMFVFKYLISWILLYLSFLPASHS